MIFTHLPGPEAYRIDVDGIHTAYLVIMANERRAAVWYATWEVNQRTKINGYRELYEITPTNIETLPPFFASYVRRWWDKWGIVHAQNHSL